MKKKNSTIGIDVGGTKIYAACFDINGKINTEIQVPTPSMGSIKTLIETLIEIIKKILSAESQRENIVKIGIGWPGIIDPKRKIINVTPHIPHIKNTDITGIIEKEIGIPVRIENDANCFALAEAKVQNKKNIVGVIIGTGLGGGIIKHGKIVQGKTGEEGEFAPWKWKNGKNFQDILAGRKFRFLKKTGNKKWQMALIDLLEIITKQYAPEEIIFGGSVAKNILSSSLRPDKEGLRGIHARKKRILLQEIQKKFTEQLQKKEIQKIPKLIISTLKNAGALGASML